MKKFIAAIGLLGLVAFSYWPAQAQNNAGLPIGMPVVLYSQFSLNVSNNWTLNNASNIIATATLADSSLLCLQLYVSNNTAETSNTVVTLDTSPDGIIWHNNEAQMRIANTGTTTAECRSNLTALANMVYRFAISNDFVTGVATATVTNYVTLKATFKRGL